MVIKAYAATRNSDQTEGKGHTVTIALFAHRADAVKAAAGQGVMGYGNGDVEPRDIHIYESYKEYVTATDAALYKSAMSKLSPEERRVLQLVQESTGVFK